VDKVGLFYIRQDYPHGTHLALRWKGRIRFTIPRDIAAQQTCWKIFRPGRAELMLRVMARLPRISGAISCVENENLLLIRKAIGKDTGLSCCRTGTPGPWSKDTILLLNMSTNEPMYIVKAGAGEAVDLLLQNEATWLRTLRDQPALADHIPDLVAHNSGAQLSFVAETPLLGKLDYQLGELHIVFLRKLQKYSHCTIRLEESRLYKNLQMRLKDLSGLLSEAWSSCLQMGIRRIEQSLSGRPVSFVAAHNDFTPWNIRVQRGVVRLFDWEYADYEQLPLFDPLHFVLMPMALWKRPTVNMIRCMKDTLQLSEQWFGKELCHNAQTQALAYLMNLCTLYLWAERGKSNSNPVLESYASIIDFLCQ
jgi:hypothetical protein